jgi:transforming growth factor-beta-induced protein
MKKLSLLIVMILVLVSTVMPTMAQEENIVEVADGAGNFTTLIAAAQAAGLADTLATGGPFTVFAPTDDAFAALLTSLNMTAEEVLANTDLLTSVLLYHVVDGAVYAETVVNMNGAQVETLNGAAITVSVTDSGVVLNDGVNVIATDIEASNGVIHVIDSVLLPPS